MEKAAISVQELSEQLGISLPMAYELVKRPGFPVIRMGTRFLIPVEEFKKWLSSEVDSNIKEKETNSYED